MSGERLTRQHPRERWAFLCRWLLVGQMAFSQLGSRAASVETPSSAWVQMLPEEPDGWHPLETVHAATILTIELRLGDRDAGWRGRCPN